MSINHEYKIVIVGAGPAGTTLALFLAKNKIPHLLLDKANFPRDKVCGDACTPEVARVLRELDEKLYQEFITADWVTPSNGMYLESYSGSNISLDFTSHIKDSSINYVVERNVLDEWLVSKLGNKYTTTIYNCNVQEIKRNQNGVQLRCLHQKEELLINSKLVIGADGERSIVRKTFHTQGIRKNRAHHAASIRGYYENVEGTDPSLPLEFYVPSNDLPCYLWIFHLKNGKANVGIGAMSSDVSRKKINLNNELEKFLATHPRTKKRFKNSKKISKTNGWGIPINSNAKDFHGDNYLLIGDSASMAEPLTGKGIGIAMYASMMAVSTIQKALKNEDYSLDALRSFETDINKKFRKEWAKLDRLRKLTSYPVVVNMIIKIGNLPLI